MTVYCLLDYDGYIAKSFYAGFNKDNPTDFTDCYECLENMTQFAINKTLDYFKRPTDTNILKVISGHTFKKDIYPSYKGNRTPDEYLGMYRDEIKSRYNDELLTAYHLEADDLLVLLNEQLRENSIVFSDDKDLHKYCKYTCKLNESEFISSIKYGAKEQLIQMISGDTIDNIKGVPKFGEKSAKKYLDENGYTFESVIKLYKEKGISIDECTKNIVLVHPCAQGASKFGCEETMKYITNEILFGDDEEIIQMNIMTNIFEYLNTITNRIKEVYNSDNKENV